MKSAVGVVLKKELREMLRDKRVRTGAFVMPILIIVMLMGVLGFVVKQVKEPHNTKIYVVASSSPIIEELKKQKLTVITVATLDEGKALLKSGRARVVLEIQSTTAESLPVTQINAYVDPKEQQGQMAFGAVAGVVQAENKKSLQKLFEAKQVPAAAQEPIRLAKKDLQVGSEQNAGEILVSLLPYLIVIWAFYGGMNIAGDLVAGEKEKATLETLLITPAKRTDIVLGKFLALATICLASSFMSVVGLALVAIIKLPGTAELLGKGGGVTPVAAVFILILMIPTAALFASMLIAVSSYAKNAREAQTYMTSMSFLVVLPGIFSQFIGLTEFGTKLWINGIPILNTANNIRNALLGKTEFLPMLITVALSTVLAAIALTITVRLFQREQVLVRV